MPTQKRLVASRSDVESVLTQARQYGFIGPGPIEPQIDHALRFGEALVGEPSTGRAPCGAGVDPDTAGLVERYADLGAGGGLPSLPLLALELRSTRAVLVDASGKRTAFLVWACVELGLTERVEVWNGRAEVFGRAPERRGAFDAVIARGFGPPASTIECAAPLLRLGGRCVISEPPDARPWPGDALGEIGMELALGPEGFAVFSRVGEVPEGLPRNAKAQRRAPLFTL